MAKKAVRRKKKAPSSARKKKVMGDAVRKAMTNAMNAVKTAEQAKAQAEQKVFAAKLIAHIAREAGIKGPPAAVKKKVIAQARRRAAAARQTAQQRVAAARKKALARQKAARRTAGLA